MDLAKYEELTGKTVPMSKRAFYNALIKRTQSKLEILLGYSFEPLVLYEELGKTQMECICPDIPQSSELLPPDEVKGIIKVFPYNDKDRFLHIDPFKDVYSVKLVRVTENRKFITYKVFENVTEQMGGNGLGGYIEKCPTCGCECDCKNCVQLAVDASWMKTADIPEDLLYLWCDMIDFYSDEHRDIKSESVDGHSWSRGDVKAPEEDKISVLLLQKYAGPFGSVTKVPVL